MEAQVIGILDGAEETRRLELVMETDDEQSPRLALKFATYSEGLGWLTQKTIHIDAQQAEQLQFLLGGARHLLKQAEKQTTVAAGPRVVRAFPARRPARKSA